MGKVISAGEVLDYAIARELEAHEFYARLSHSLQRPEMQGVLEAFAAEELRHKTRVEAVKAGRVAIPDEEIGSLGIVEKIRDVTPHTDMTYAEILALAMKKEEAAHRLYSSLASIAYTQELRKIFLELARDEAEHKLRFEVEYDWETF